MILRADDVQKSYGTVRVLRGVSLKLDAGERVAVLGPSGSGKSTFLNCLGGIDRADSGRIEIQGVTLNGLDEAGLARLRRESIGHVFQFFHLLPTLTADENIALPLQLLHWKPDARRRRVDELLAAVRLENRRSAYPDTLSGGERQRVALARALAARPALLLADEPTGNLDDRSGQTVLDLLRDLTDRSATALVLVTHSRAAAAICHRVLDLHDGRVIRDHPGVDSIS